MAKEYNKIRPKNVAKVEDEQQEEVKQIKKVATAKVKKPGLIRRFFIGIGGPEAGSNIVKYLTNEIIAPAVKDIIYNTITSGTKMAVYGEDYPRHTERRSNIKRVGYTDYSTRGEVTYAKTRERSRNRLQELAIPTREEAKKVLEQLIEISGMNQFVTVADYYDMFDNVKISPTHVDWGWTYDQILGTTIIPDSDGFILNLPTPVEV